MLIVRMAGDHARQHDVLTDTQICRTIRHKAQAAFEQAQARLLAVLVVHYRRQQAGPQRQAHRRHFDRNRARQDQRFFIRMQQRLHFRIDEAIGDRFLITVIDQHGLHALERQVGFAMLSHHQIGAHRHIRDVVVAVNARHFFHQVLFDLHIETPARRHCLPVVALFGHLATQAAQNVANLLARHHVADQAIQLLAAQRDGSAFRQFVFIGHVNNRAGLAAADVQQQARSAFHRFVLQRRIDAALIAVRSIGMQAVTACAAGDRQRAEEGAFQQHVLSFPVNAGMFAAEDAPHRQRFLVIGDH